MELIAIIAGSALGGMARFAVADAIARRWGHAFPWGTLVVNASGALAAGACAAVLLDGFAPDPASLAWPLAVIGFLGSYTTVSSFSLETLALAHERAWRAAAANVLLSLVLPLAAAVLGLLLGTRLAGLLP